MNFNDQVNRLWDEWMEATGQETGDPAEFVDWAVARGCLSPRPEDVKKVLRRQVTSSLRNARRYDEAGGFSYRARQSVTLFDEGEARKFYFDTDSGGSPTLRQKSVRERRDAIADDVYRAQCDVERMNAVHAEDPQLNFVLDFSDDVEERRDEEREALHERNRKTAN